MLISTAKVLGFLKLNHPHNKFCCITNRFEEGEERERGRGGEDSRKLELGLWHFHPGRFSVEYVCVECGNVCVGVMVVYVGRGFSPVCVNWTNSIRHIISLDFIPIFSDR